MDMSNNWRKMHGMPMMRKSCRRIDRPKNRCWYRNKEDDAIRMLWDYMRYIDLQILREVLYAKGDHNDTLCTI